MLVNDFKSSQDYQPFNKLLTLNPYGKEIREKNLDVVEDMDKADDDEVNELLKHAFTDSN